MILYFTGTGNSGLVARRLADLLNDKAIRLQYPFPQSLELGDDTRLVWVFPVYSWGIPPVVRKIISRIELSPDVEQFMVCTCGDDIGLTAGEWRKLIRKRGWKPVGCWSVQMPNIYVLLPGFNVDSTLVERQKLANAPLRLDAVARGIRHSARVDDVVKGSFAWVKSKILKPLFVKFLMSPKPFGYNERCVGCGTCSRKCPMGNIDMINDRPAWGKRCALCLECYHCCPCHAVKYGRITETKGQYQPPELLQS